MRFDSVAHVSLRCRQFSTSATSLVTSLAFKSFLWANSVSFERPSRAPTGPLISLSPFGIARRLIVGGFSFRPYLLRCTQESPAVDRFSATSFLEPSLGSVKHGAPVRCPAPPPIFRSFLLPSLNSILCGSTVYSLLLCRLARRWFAL